MSYCDHKGRPLSETRTPDGPSDSDVDGFESYDLDSEEYYPDDFESDYFEDEIGENFEDLASDMQDRDDNFLNGLR